MKQVLVLFSGGMDSTVALMHTLQRATRGEFDKVHTLTFNYGQRHTAELHAASRITSWLRGYEFYAQKLGAYLVQHVSLPRTGSLLNRSIPVDKYDGIADATALADKDTSFIPHRNLLFFVYAAMEARQHDCVEIVSGIRGGFPDCSEAFERDAQQLLQHSDPHYPVMLTSPVHMSRADTINLAYTIDGCMDAIGFSLTCFEGTAPPCGHCLPCIKRAEGFAQAGMTDPLTAVLAGIPWPKKRPLHSASKAWHGIDECTCMNREDEDAIATCSVHKSGHFTDAVAWGGGS